MVRSTAALDSILDQFILRNISLQITAIIEKDVAFIPLKLNKNKIKITGG